MLAYTYMSVHLCGILLNVLVTKAPQVTLSLQTLSTHDGSDIRASVYEAFIFFVSACYRGLCEAQLMSVHCCPVLVPGKREH